MNFEEVFKEADIIINCSCNYRGLIIWDSPLGNTAKSLMEFCFNEGRAAGCLAGKSRAEFDSKQAPSPRLEDLEKRVKTVEEVLVLKRRIEDLRVEVAALKSYYTGFKT